MLEEKKLNLIGQILLFAITLAWGTSFVVLKETIDALPPIFVVALRFVTAGLIFGIVFIKRTVKIKKSLFLRASSVGVCLFLAYLAQTFGLKYGTPSRNAFITSLYCVMTPFLVWIFSKVKPKSYNVIAAVMCVVGIGFIALPNAVGEQGGMLFGDILTFIGAIFFAFQIILIEFFAKREDDVFQFITVELFSAGVCMALYSLCVELPMNGISAFKLDGNQLLRITYMTLVCTLFAQFGQLLGQRFVTPNQSAVILSLEAVFGTVFSVITGTESLTVFLFVGFVIIFIGTLVSELKIDVLKLFRKKEKKGKDERDFIEEKDL